MMKPKPFISFMRDWMFDRGVKRLDAEQRGWYINLLSWCWWQTLRPYSSSIVVLGELIGHKGGALYNLAGIEPPHSHFGSKKFFEILEQHSARIEKLFLDYDGNLIIEDSQGARW
jgi:hypothetical protein